MNNKNPDTFVAAQWARGNFISGDQNEHRSTVRHAYFLVLPNTHVLDLAGPLQIMATLKELGLAQVDVECIGPLNTVRTFQNTVLSEVRPLPARLRPGAVLFVIGSKLDATLTRSRPWLDAVAWVRERTAQVESGLQMCGVCTGTLLLAEAGLLNGRLCTTHHRFIQKIKQNYPLIHMVENRVFVRDRNVWTSAGVTSGIDMTLHLVAEAFGDDAAIQVARENVVHFRRFGADPELSPLMRHRSHCNSRIHVVQDAIAKDLARRVTCGELAESVGFSVRHLTRVFVAETGITIKRFQTELRLDLARRLMVGSTLSLERIAEQCGFGSVQALRANWDKREDQPPSALRARRAMAPDKL